MDMCRDQRADATPESRASTLAQANLSCAALGKQAEQTDWLCTAEGAISAGYSVGEKDTRGIRMLGNGRTRSVAVHKALSNCYTAMTMDLGIQQTTSSSDTLGEWEAETTSECITRCIAPASARKQRQR